LITDIVRCAVVFDSASDMKLFVTNWIVRFGQSERSAVQLGGLKMFLNECSLLFHDFREHFSSSVNIQPDTSDTPHQQVERPSEAANANLSQSSSSEDDDFKLFEIHRIKNRLDPELIEVPCGYRDIAVKLKIGFVR
jgi:hypothetical protein